MPSKVRPPTKIVYPGPQAYPQQPQYQQPQYMPPQKSGGMGNIGVVFVTVLLSAMVTFFMLSFLGASKTDLQSVSNRISTAEGNIGTIDKSVNKALGFESRIKTLEDWKGGLVIPDTSAYANKADVTSLFNGTNLTDAQVTDLKKKLGLGTGGTSNPGGTTNPGAVGTTNDVTVGLWKDTPDIVYTGGKEYTWWLEIKNGFAEYKKVFITFNASPVTGDTHLGNVVTYNNSVSAPDGTYAYIPDFLSSGGNKFFSMNYIPVASTPGAVSTGCSMISGQSIGYAILKGNTSAVYPFTLKLLYSDTNATRWEVTFSRLFQNWP